MKNKGIIGAIAGIMVIGMTTTLCTSFYITRKEEMESSEYAAAEGIRETQDESLLETFAMTASPEGQMEKRSLAKAVPDDGQTDPETSIPSEDGAEGTPGVALAKEAPAKQSEQEDVLGADANIAAFDVSITDSSETEESAQELSPHHKRLMELDAQIQKIRDEETESTTYSMKTAAENELKLWDSELNAIYNDILALLNEEKRTEMVKQEREWMKERDALAVEAARRSAGGTLEGLEYTASLAESTRQRAYELADLYTQLLEEGP